MANALFTNFANLIGGNGTHSLPTLHGASTLKAVGLDESALTGGINLGTDVDAAELYDATADIYADTIGDSVICIGTLTTVTFTGGALDADNEVFSSVAEGDPIDSYIVLNSVTNDASSPLLFYYDTGTNIPTTPNGGDITLAWGSGGLFKLVP